MFYHFVRLSSMVIFKILFRLKITGFENIPREGALIVSANHRSYLDPVLVSIAIRNRTVSSMAKYTLFRYPIFGTALRMVNAFPVKKGVADKAALVRSLRILENKEVLVIFPEGTRFREGGMGPAYPGATTIALKTGTTILPIGISGTDKVLPDGVRIPRLPKIRIRIGKPIQVEKVSGPERKAQEKILTDRLMSEITKLVSGD